MVQSPHIDAVPKSIVSRKINGMRTVAVPQGQSVVDKTTVRRQSVQELWLQGHRAPEISVELDCAVSTVITDIRSFRKDLYENNQASLQEHTEQTVAIFRKVESHLWDLFQDEGISPFQQAKLLEQIRRTEESVAKARGILQSRVIADVVHQVKLYDFTDSFPAPLETKAIEATVTDTSKDPNYSVPDISDDVPDYRGKPDFTPAEGPILLPDSTWVEE
jgi:DNA-binding CsgD family transcriptional regulator